MTSLCLTHTHTHCHFTVCRCIAFFHLKKSVYCTCVCIHAGSALPTSVLSLPLFSLYHILFKLWKYYRIFLMYSIFAVFICIALLDAFKWQRQLIKDVRGMISKSFLGWAWGRDEVLCVGVCQNWRLMDGNIELHEWHGPVCHAWPCYGHRAQENLAPRIIGTRVPLHHNKVMDLVKWPIHFES